MAEKAGAGSRRMTAVERRADLIRHALGSYVALGLGRAGHGDVARRAGVSTGTVFNYFPTREALTGTVLERVEAAFLALLGDVERIVDHDAERLRSAVAEACGRAPDEFRLLLSWSRSFNPDIRPQYLAAREEALARIATYLDTGAHAPSDARILLSVALTYMQMHFDDTDDAVMRDFARRLGVLIATQRALAAE